MADLFSLSKAWLNYALAPLPTKFGKKLGNLELARSGVIVVILLLVIVFIG